MMIIDPVTLGDVSCTRASTATYFDRNGVLQTAPANTLRVTYDPSDLTKAPYALVEAAATNLFLWSDLESTATGAVAPNVGGGGAASMTVSTDVAPPYGTKCVRHAYTGSGPQDHNVGTKDFSAATGTYFSMSLLLYIPSGYTGTYVSTDVEYVGLTEHTVINGANLSIRDAWQVIEVRGRVGAVNGNIPLVLRTETASPIYTCCWQAVAGAAPVTRSSFFPTTSAPATRAADVIAPGAGLVYSNVAIAETPYNSGSTYGLNAVVYDPTTYLTYQSLIANNTGRVLTDTTAWTPLKLVVNQRLMLDQYNNTQTSNPEEIIIVLSPRAIAQGIFLGNVDSAEIRISSVDLSAGLVYQEVQSMLVSTSGGSFYNWCFKRWKKRSYAVSVQLPPYANALVTIAIKKPGGTPKCGMCVLGPLVDVGLAQYGLSREIKDYSTVNFNFDGTSNVMLRNFAKIMDVDLVIDNEQIDSVIEALEGYRQKPVAWIGTAIYGSACLFGTYTSFKNVISYPTQSNMSLQIQGTV